MAVKNFGVSVGRSGGGGGGGGGGSTARQQPQSGPIFPSRRPHQSLKVGETRVTHRKWGSGTLLGYKHRGTRTGDTSGGLSSDGFVRIRFDNVK